LEGLNVRLAISEGVTATWSGQMSMGGYISEQHDNYKAEKLEEQSRATAQFLVSAVQTLDVSSPVRAQRNGGSIPLTLVDAGIQNRKLRGGSGFRLAPE
jgi:hypothetical protein